MTLLGLLAVQSGYAQTDPRPTITSKGVTTATEDVLYNYDVEATDPQMDPLTYSLAAGPSGMSINSSTGLVSWIPDNSQAQGSEHSVIVRVEDPGSNFDVEAYTINVTNTNDPPSITSTTITNATEDAVYGYDVDATDPDVGDVLSYSLTTFPSGMSINSSTGLISWTPDNSQVGSHPVLVEVFDEAGASDPQPFDITVVNTNDPPVIVSTEINRGYPRGSIRL